MLSRRIRLWQYESLWRIQFYSQIVDRHGVPQGMWRSHCRNGQVMMFESEQLAREYMRRGNEKRTVEG